MIIGFTAFSNGGLILTLSLSIYKPLTLAFNKKIEAALKIFALHSAE